MGDLDSRNEIHDLVVGFYREVVFDDLLAPVFAEVAEVDWATHIPKLIDYWCRVLLGEPGYEGAILVPHRHVHDLEPLRREHFDRWYDALGREHRRQLGRPGCRARQAPRSADRGDPRPSPARRSTGTPFPSPQPIDIGWTTR